MLLARVIGDVVSTVKDPCYTGRKILWVQPIDLAGQPKGDPLITLDGVGAGAGERVLVLQEGGGSQMILGCKLPSPIGTAIIAIVDEIHEPVDPEGSQAARPEAPRAAKSDAPRAGKPEPRAGKEDR